MKKLSGLLAVSLVAIMMAPAAFADIASTEYVDKNMEVKANKKKSGEQLKSNDEVGYPSVAAAAEMAAEIANGAINENAVIKQQGPSHGDRILTTNPAGEVKPVDVTDNETGYVVTGVDVKEGEFILNRGNVQVPVGSATATTYAPIWIE